MRHSLRALAALLVTSALSTPALAQLAAPPVRQSVDQNGVELFSGAFTAKGPTLNIGKDAQGLSTFWVNSGSGWSPNLTPTLTPQGSSGYLVWMNGHTERFTGSGTVYTSTEGNGSTLTVGPPVVYTSRDGMSVTFGGPLSDASSMTFPNGKTITYSYSSLVYCTAGTQLATGGWKCSAHSTAYHLTSATSNFGYRLTPTYGTWNPGSFDQNNPSISPQAAGYYTVTGVTAQNLAVSSGGSAAQSFSAATYPTFWIKDPMGNTITYQMNGGSVTGITLPGQTTQTITIGYTNGRVTSYATPAGTTTYASSDAGNVRTVTMTDPLGHTTTYKFDIPSNLMTSVTDANNHTTTMQYDSYGRATQITQPENNHTTWTYDARGNITQMDQTAKSGSGVSDIITTANYDASCSYAAKCNKPNWTKDALGNETDYTYDNTTGNVLTITQPAPVTGAVRPQMRFSYTSLQAYYNVSGAGFVASGQPVSLLTATSACQTSASCTGTSDELKSTTSYGPQATGTGNNLLPVSLSKGDGTGALTATTSYVFDAIGNETYVTDPNGNMTRQIYDADRHLVGIISPSPGNGQPDRATKYSYDAAGNLWETSHGTTTDQSDTAWANFSEAYHLYSQIDSSNRIIRQTLWSNGTNYGVWDFVYDPLNRPVCRVQYMNPATWGPQATTCAPLQTTGPYGADQVTQNVYDAAGELTQVQVGVGTADAANERTLTYTPNGKLQTLTDGDNNKTTYVYDGFDRLSQTQYPSPTQGSGTSNSSDYEQLGYDPNGNVLSRRQRDGNTISYSFDNLNRMTVKTLPSGEVPVSYTYDNLGHTTGITESGYAMSFTYDALGRQTAENQGFGSITRQFDLAGNLTRTTWWDGFYVTYDLLPTGEVSAVRENGATSGVGVLASYTYDKLGNRTGVTFGNGVSQAYTFDAVARISQLTNTFVGSTTSNLTATFAYSPASQISNTSRVGDVYAYTNSRDTNRGYTSNGLNQYSAVSSAPYAYDTKGNLTSDGTNTYTYWAQNWLKSATGGTTISYDPLGRMVEYDTSVSTRFVYDGPQIAAEVNNPAGAIQHRYVWGDDPDELIVDYVGSGTNSRQFASRDERGSIISLTDSAGNLVGTKPNTYDEYGIPGSANQGRFQYTGQAWMPEIGMYYYKARMYSTQLGRFMQTDPIGYADGPNWYAYAHNDPVNGSDPIGLAQDDSTAIEIVKWIEPPPGQPGHDMGPGSGALTGGAGTVGGPGDTNGDPIIVQGRRLTVPPSPAPNPPIYVIAAHFSPPGPLGDRGFGGGGATGTWPGCGCVVAGTLVWTPSGAKAIESIKVGDLVEAEDEQTGKIAAKRVTGLLRPGPKPIYDVTLQEAAQDEHIEATADHPWKSRKYGWVLTGRLRPGDKVENGLHGELTVSSVTLTTKVQRTFNLDVADWHTYMIGADHAVVHNGCDEDKIAQRYLRNVDFRRWFHRYYKAQTGFGDGGGARNPDMSPQDILDAWDEWVSLGRPTVK